MKKILILLQALTALAAALFVYIHSDTGAFLFLIIAIGLNCLALVYPETGAAAPKKVPPADFVVKFKAPKGG